MNAPRRLQIARRRAAASLSAKALVRLAEIDAQLRDERAAAQTLLADVLRRWSCLAAVRGLIEEQRLWQAALLDSDDTSAGDRLAKKIARDSLAEQNLARECGEYTYQALRAYAALKLHVHALETPRRKILTCGFSDDLREVTKDATERA